MMLWLFDTVFMLGSTILREISYCPGPVFIDGFSSKSVFLIPVELNGAENVDFWFYSSLKYCPGPTGFANFDTSFNFLYV